MLSPEELAPFAIPSPLNAPPGNSVRTSRQRIFRGSTRSLSVADPAGDTGLRTRARSPIVHRAPRYPAGHGGARVPTPRPRGSTRVRRRQRRDDRGSGTRTQMRRARQIFTHGKHNAGTRAQTQCAQAAGRRRRRPA